MEVSGGGGSSASPSTLSSEDDVLQGGKHDVGGKTSKNKSKNVDARAPPRLPSVAKFDVDWAMEESCQQQGISSPSSSDGNSSSSDSEYDDEDDDSCNPETVDRDAAHGRPMNLWSLEFQLWQDWQDRLHLREAVLARQDPDDDGQEEGPGGGASGAGGMSGTSPPAGTDSAVAVGLLGRGVKSGDFASFDQREKERKKKETEEFRKKEAKNSAEKTILEKMHPAMDTELEER